MGILTRSFQPMPFLGPVSHGAMTPSGRAELGAERPRLSREPNLNGLAMDPSGLLRPASTGVKAAHLDDRLFRLPFGHSGRTSPRSAGQSGVE
jgi:hypothetical protein